MLLTKSMTMFNPKVGYLLLDTDVFLYATDEGEDIDRDMPPYVCGTEGVESTGPARKFNLYNGPVRFFRSLTELNDHLCSLDINSRNPNNNIFVYKGHLFLGKKFPIKPKKGYDKFFIIEKIDNSVCFAEEIGSLKEAAESVSADTGLLLGTEEDPLNNYLIFAGKSKRAIYRCIDSDIDAEE